MPDNTCCASSTPSRPLFRSAVAAANETLSSLAPRFRFAVVTSRQAAVEGATRSWLERQFPGIFESVHFGNHYASDGSPARSKAEICKEIGAVALIDDSRHHALECARAGLKCVILFGDYSWNRPSMGTAPESAGAGASAAAAAADNTLLAAMSNVFPCPDWRLVKPVLQRITPSGELADVPSLWVRGGAEEASAMRARAEATLMRQSALDVTAVGVSITPLLTLVAGLKHEGLVEEVKTSSGLDAGYNASTGRMPRLTVKVRRTPKLLEDAAARERALAVEADALRDASKRRALAAFAKAGAAAAAGPATTAAQA